VLVCKGRKTEMTVVSQDILKLLLAILIGGLIGAEREYRDKAAGFRTIMLICAGAAIFTILSDKLGGNMEPSRIAAGIVSGVGFLGAGAILRGSRHVTGLTTASTIWLAAALGMGIGGGQYIMSCAAAVAVLVVLLIFPKIERRIDDIRDERTYEVVCPVGEEKFREIEALFFDNGLRVTSAGRTKSGENMISRWQAYGRPEEHERLIKKLFAHADVKEFHM
jgi:putative Mg2+ transporter-C (MgtC) family protein